MQKNRNPKTKNKHWVIVLKDNHPIQTSYHNELREEYTHNNVTLFEHKSLKQLWLHNKELFTTNQYIGHGLAMQENALSLSTNEKALVNVWFKDVTFLKTSS